MSFIKDIRQSVNQYLDGRVIASLSAVVNLIAREREELKSWSDKELKLAALAFKDDLSKGESLDSLLVPAFAVVNEAARRVLGQVPYDVQVIGGIVIHQGKVAEMKAGEGKTLTETMPVYLNALAGQGVHIVTTNDYLAERDAKQMGKLYDVLGLTTGYVTSSMKNDDRRKAYAADITYVTNQEVGFDFLRDNLVYAKSDRVLRPKHPLHYGIVDEIDSILIDESRTPLIIAEAVKEERNLYDRFVKIVNKLVEDKDFAVDYVHKNVAMTSEGLDKLEELLGGPIFSKDNPRYAFYLDVCLRAKFLFERDRDYIVTGGGVEIVDEFTGRVLPGRRFTDGVHQAIEAKEAVEVKESDRTQAAITFQNFFPMYEKLSGMSGTVMGARDEFNQVYKLDVIQIPTNRPLVRVDHNDLFFKTQKGKYSALLKKVRQITKRGQPILIGARNVETAHAISQLLESHDLPFQLLTAKDHKAEAEKIAKAGARGMITVATNMAGRGTDILLGDDVRDVGLFVFGTERHESRRIDDQLVGRSGRQGEPGESVFLVSMEDEIMQLFGNEHIIDLMEEIDIPEDEYISGKSLDQAFSRAQEFVDSKNYDGRVYLYKYDRVVNSQRAEVYRLRDHLLENEPAFAQFLESSAADVLTSIFANGASDQTLQQVKQIFNFDEKGFKAGEPLSDNLEEKVTLHVSRELKKLKKAPAVYEAAQNLILEVIDDHWSSHLELMDILKQEAGLLSYASEEPLLEFIKESRILFSEMGKSIQQEFLKTLFGRVPRS